LLGLLASVTGGVWSCL